MYPSLYDVVTLKKDYKPAEFDHYYGSTKVGGISFYLMNSQ